MPYWADAATKVTTAFKPFVYMAALEAGQYAGLRLQLSPAQRALLVSDARGDNLDAVLCLLQAAWALQRHQQGVPLYGLPPDMDPLEGWIVGA